MIPSVYIYCPALPRKSSGGKIDTDILSSEYQISSREKPSLNSGSPSLFSFYPKKNPPISASFATMKLTTLLVSAVMALGVAGVDPEAGNDVEVRDFSGESVTEFDARDEEDLEARTDYNKCGWGAYERQGECYCTNSKDYVSPHL